MDYIKLIGGLILLIISGEFLVRGGADLAKRFRLSPLVIGMTIVAFGTSAPELLVSLISAIKGSSDIAIGNVVGSNIANIALILGFTALIYPLSVPRRSIRVDWVVMIATTLVFALFAYDGTIERWEGLLLFISLIVFVYFQLKTSHVVEMSVINPNDNPEKVIVERVMPVWLSAILIIIACAGLSYGANILVDGAKNIALDLGVSEKIIGITVIALGTSLPELVASVIAAMKKETDIAIGNIIGSNIFNILCVIGLSSCIVPIHVNWISFRSDIIWMFGFSIALLIYVLPFFEHKGKDLFNHGKLGRVGGAALLLGYCLYIATLF